MSILKIKKSNGEELRIIDNEFVIGAGGACQNKYNPCIKKKIINGEYVLNECKEDICNFDDRVKNREVILQYTDIYNNEYCAEEILLYLMPNFFEKGCLTQRESFMPTTGCSFYNQKEYSHISFKGAERVKIYQYLATYDLVTYPDFSNNSDCDMFNNDSWFKSAPPLWCPESLDGNSDCIFSCHGYTKAIVYDEALDQVYIIESTTEMPIVYRFVPGV